MAPGDCTCHAGPETQAELALGTALPLLSPVSACVVTLLPSLCKSGHVSLFPTPSTPGRGRKGTEDRSRLKAQTSQRRAGDSGLCSTYIGFDVTGCRMTWGARVGVSGTGTTSEREIRQSETRHGRQNHPRGLARSPAANNISPHRGARGPSVPSSVTQTSHTERDQCSRCPRTHTVHHCALGSCQKP